MSWEAIGIATGAGVTTGMILATPLVVAMRVKRPSHQSGALTTESPIDMLNAVRSGGDAVAFLRACMPCAFSGADEISECLSDLIVSQCYKIKDSTVERMSALAKVHANDHGEEGYAVMLIWGCIVASASSHVLSFSDD